MLINIRNSRKLNDCKVKNGENQKNSKTLNRCVLRKNIAKIDWTFYDELTRINGAWKSPVDTFRNVDLSLNHRSKYRLGAIAFLQRDRILCEDRSDTRKSVDEKNDTAVVVFHTTPFSALGIQKQKTNS